MPAIVRLARDGDATAVREIYAPAVVDGVASFETVLPPAVEFAARVRDVLTIAPWLVLEDGGVVAGYAYATRFRSRAAYRWTVETTVYVRDSHHRRGVGRALYDVLLDLLRRQGFRQAIAGITLPNAASVALHEAFGFRRCGVYAAVGWKHGHWRDVAELELTLQALPDPPPEPRLLPAMMAEPPFARLVAGQPIAKR